MSTTQSAEEIKKEQIAILGPEFGSLYNLLYNEIIWLHYKWTEFEELYGIEESRIKIMNNTAPSFFSMIQKILWENIISGIARITGQQETEGENNMTITAVPELINDQKLKESVEIKIKTILEKTNFCRDWRNRKIAHYDYDLSINSNAKPLEKASKILVKEALNEITALIDLLHGFYFKSTLILDQIQSNRGALSLLYTLDDGLKERENYFNRSGVWGPEGSNFNPNEIK